MSNWEPKIIAFFCNWCTYGAADLAGVSCNIPPIFCQSVCPVREESVPNLSFPLLEMVWMVFGYRDVIRETAAT